MKNNETRFFYVLYSDKTWVFDQSERAQGPIYILIQINFPFARMHHDPQAAQAFSIIWHRIMEIFYKISMEVVKVKILNKNGLPYLFYGLLYVCCLLPVWLF